MLTAPLVAAGLVLGCLGAGRALLDVDGAASARPRSWLRVDAVAGLTGLAVLTALAGWLVLAGAYSEMAGWGLLTVGVGTLFLRAARSPGKVSMATPEPLYLRAVAVLLALLALALAMLRVLSEFDPQFLSDCDDFPSYFHFPRLLIESGGFIEPFNLRRLGMLGAAPFVQSFFWRDFTTSAGPMTDAVIGQLLVWAAARSLPSALSGRKQPAWIGEAFGLGALVASLTIWNINTVPVLLPMGGALVLILLTRSMAHAATDTEGRRAALAWGLVAAWLIGLRTINVTFPALFWLLAAVLALRGRDREQGVRLAVAGAATLVGLLPWCLALWRSSGTPLFPFIAGNYRFDGLFSAPLDTQGVLAFVANSLWASRVWVIALLGVLALRRPGVRLLSVQVVAALLVMVAVTAATLTAFDSFTIHRYCAPFLAAGVVFLAGAALFGGDQSPQGALVPLARRPSPLWVWGVLLFWLVVPVELRMDRDPFYLPNIGGIEVNVTRRRPAALEALRSGLQVVEYPGRDHYDVAQALLPADARLASATEMPFFFRFDRQVIHTLDCLGQVSPAPGMPFFQGPEALVEYLRGLGYTHLAFTPSRAGSCLYSRDHWEEKRANGTFVWQKWAPYFLDFMANMERLEATQPVLYKAADLVVIDLGPSQQQGN